MSRPVRHQKRVVLGEGYPWPHGVGPHTSIGLHQTRDGKPVRLDVPSSLWSEEVPVYVLVLERKGSVSPENLVDELGSRLHDAISALSENDAKARAEAAKKLVGFLKSNDILDENRIKRIVSVGVGA